MDLMLAAEEVIETEVIEAEIENATIATRQDTFLEIARKKVIGMAAAEEEATAEEEE